ncbi:hypothetical protein Rsub_07775 [Raphidocelis subcapitata]|uniref:Low temperature requirement A n=1 Tax=Raphidocelis subcapitata TaxID=307507 RepID=A0A2V0PDU8_9CHLO|nr:hypothetical protein Rsub_07775 [Raphidocelis subcapitata]|eukprot:GBF95347.1 hypothetical protein Rsub_07775 [Raphidocelis subcapitata]
MASLPLRRLIAAPHLLQDWCDGGEQEERHADWTELFFDLFVVAAVSATVHLFTADPTWRGAGRMLLYLGLFHFTWTSNTHLMTRIHMGRLAFDALRLLRHLGVLGMTLGAQDFGRHRRLFAGSYLLVRAVSLLCFAAVWAALPRARAYAALSALLHATMAALALAAAAGGAPSVAAHTALMGAVLALEAAAPAVVVAVPAANLPLHVGHIDERLGLLQIIYLGESIVAIATSPLGSDSPALQVLGAGLGAVVVWALFLSIYHLEASEHRHALRQSKLRGLAFLYLHAALGAALNTSGAGLLMALETYSGGKQGGGEHGGEYLPHVAWTLCASYGAALHLIAAVRATHYLKLPRRPRGRRRSGLGGAAARAGAARGGAAAKMLPPEAAPAAHRVRGRLWAWWAFAGLWPCVAYVLPFAANAAGTGGSLRTTGLLGCIAAHALAYVLVEAVMSHAVASEVEGAIDQGGDGGGEGGGGEGGGGEAGVEERQARCGGADDGARSVAEGFGAAMA